MIFHVGQPVVLLAMAVGLVVAVLIHNLAQAVTARALGDPAARLNRRKLIDPKREFEPFGIIAMVIGGLGWGRPVGLTEPRARGGRKARFITALLMGPLADVLIGLTCVAAYAVFTGAGLFAPRGQHVPVHPNAGYAVLGLVGVLCVAVGILYLIPLPPLDGARIMWALAPPTAGWQRARYNLEEQNYGLGALVIFSLPLFSGEGLIVRIVYAVAEPLVDVVMRALGPGR